MRGAAFVFCMHTLSAASFTMQPELLTKQCDMRLERLASATRNSPNATLSWLLVRLPCMQRSERPARSAAATIRGSPCPNMCTPIPFSMSHFTLPSRSSTSGPLPMPVPRYGMMGPRPRTSAVRFMACANDSLRAGSAARAPVIDACAARTRATMASMPVEISGSAASGEESALIESVMRAS